jgi:hypothetical protein
MQGPLDVPCYPVKPSAKSPETYRTVQVPIREFSILTGRIYAETFAHSFYNESTVLHFYNSEHLYNAEINVALQSRDLSTGMLQFCDKMGVRWKGDSQLQFGLINGKRTTISLWTALTGSVVLRMAIRKRRNAK